MHVTNQLAKPGDTMDYSDPTTGVRIQLQVTIDGGYTRTVMTGPTVVDALSAGYTDPHTARTQARQLAQALKAGKSVWQLAADRVTNDTSVLATADDILDGALQTACAAPVTPTADTEIAHLQGFKPEDTSDLADRINADLDAQQAQDRAAQDAFNADIARIMAGSRGFRGDRKTLAQTVPAPVGHKRRGTPTGVHRKPLNELQQRVVDRAHNSRIHVGQGVSSTTLRAIADKGHGVLVMDPVVRFRVIGLDLTSKEN